jgi:voltage-gated potassium channel
VPVHIVSPDLPAERHVRELRRRFAVAIAILFGIGVVSTAALVALGSHGDRSPGQQVLLAFWDTLNLVSTVGSIEERFTTGQRVWASLVIIFGIGAVLYAFGTLQNLLQGGDVRRHIGRIRMQKRLANLRGHVVVCGYGRVGASVAAEVRRAGVTPLVIERDPAVAGQADVDGFDVLQGDATDDATLAEASLEHAAGLIATLDDDAANTFLVLMVRERHATIRIVARCTREQSRRSLLRAGADRVLVPGHVAGLQMSHLLLKPRVTDFVSAAVGEGEFDLVEMPVADHPWMVGPTLAELDLPHARGLLIISVQRPDGSTIFSPPGGHRLETDDVLLAVTRGGGMAPPPTPRPASA